MEEPGAFGGVGRGRGRAGWLVFSWLSPEGAEKAEGGKLRCVGLRGCRLPSSRDLSVPGEAPPRSE